MAHIADVATHIAVSKGMSIVIHLGYPGGLRDWKLYFLLHFSNITYKYAYKETISVSIPWCCKVNEFSPVCRDKEMSPSKSGLFLIQMGYKAIPCAFNLG